MKLILHLLLQIIIRRCLGQTYIKYDTGNLTFLFYGQNPACYNAVGQNTHSSTIIYNGIFANNPQIMIFINHFDQQRGQSEFTYFISDQSKESFTVSVECQQANPLYSLIFQWIAIDDDRILVLNQFNINVTNEETQIYTLAHGLSDASVGFVTLTDWGFSGSLAYSLEITSISNTEVNVLFTKGTVNLLSVGYQVVLGTDEAFTATSIIDLNIPANSEVGKSLTKPSGHKLFVPLAGQTWSTTGKNFRIKTICTDTDTTTSYAFATWGGTSFQKISHQQVWFNFQNSKVRVPMLCKKWRVSRKQDYTGIKARIYIKEKDYYLNYGQSDTIIIDDTFNSINIVASFRCSSVQKVIGTVLQCIDCEAQTQDISSNCYGGMNLLEHHFYFIQKDWVYQKLTITITSTSITVIQSVINTQGTVIQLQLVRQ